MSMKVRKNEKYLVPNYSYVFSYFISCLKSKTKIEKNKFKKKKKNTIFHFKYKDQRSHILISEKTDKRETNN